MKAVDFENKFNKGESVISHADISNVSHPNRAKRVNIAFPTWMINDLDIEAARLGVTRHALMKVWIADCLAQKALL